MILLICLVVLSIILLLSCFATTTILQVGAFPGLLWRLLDVSQVQLGDRTACSFCA